MVVTNQSNTELAVINGSSAVPLDRALKTAIKSYKDRYQNPTGFQIKVFETLDRYLKAVTEIIKKDRMTPSVAEHVRHFIKRYPEWDLNNREIAPTAYLWLNRNAYAAERVATACRIAEINKQYRIGSTHERCLWT